MARVRRCPGCGHSSPEMAYKCDSCGASLSGTVPSTAERDPAASEVSASEPPEAKHAEEGEQAAPAKATVAKFPGSSSSAGTNEAGENNAAVDALPGARPGRGTNMRWWAITIGLGCCTVALGTWAWHTANRRGSEVVFSTSGAEAVQWAARAKEDRWAELVIREVVDGELVYVEVPEDEIDDHVRSDTSVIVRRWLSHDDVAAQFGSLLGYSGATGAEEEESEAAAAQRSATTGLTVAAVLAALLAFVSGLVATGRLPHAQGSGTHFLADRTRLEEASPVVSSSSDGQEADATGQESGVGSDDPLGLSVLPHSSSGDAALRSRLALPKGPLGVVLRIALGIVAFYGLMFLVTALLRLTGVE